MNASRKAERQAIAALFRDAAARAGATIKEREAPRNPGWRGAAICMSFTLNGVGAQVNISDLHGGEVGLISWFNDYSEPRRAWYFLPAFNSAVGEHHSFRRPHHKATSHGTWEVLTQRLEAGLVLAASNLAFIKESE